MPLQIFHPAVQAWFEQAFSAPTAVQVDAWAAIARGQHWCGAHGRARRWPLFTAIDSLVRRYAGYIEDAAVVCPAAEGVVE
jgi:ATP-dependent Lhr-like helicase